MTWKRIQIGKHYRIKKRNGNQTERARVGDAGEDEELARIV